MHKMLCNEKNDLQHWVDELLERVAPADSRPDCVISVSLCAMELSDDCIFFAQF